MKKLIHLPKVLRLFLWLPLFIASASHAAQLPTSFKPGRLSLSATLDYLNTGGNFDESGTEQDLPSGFEYKNITSAIDGTYYFSGGWAASAGLTFANAESTNLSTTASLSGLTDFHIKGQKLLAWSRVRFVPEVSLLFTTDDILDTQTDPFLSEAADVYGAGSWVITDLRFFKLYGFLGYEFRGDGRSNLMPWTAGTAWRASRVALLAEVGGYQTIAKDEDTDTPQETLRQTTIFTANGGSSRYYNVNPSLTELRLKTHFAFSPEFLMFAGVSHALAGENTASGQVFSLGLTYNLDYGDPRAAVKKKKSTTRTRPSALVDENEDAFEPQVEEDYDETLFEGDASGEL